jgi:hypothetical protein
LRTEEILGMGDRAAVMAAALQKNIDRLGLKPGKELAAFDGFHPAAGEVMLHLVARYVGEPSFNGADGNSIVQSIIVFRQFPGEAWIRFKQSDLAALMPAADAKPGNTWELPAAISGPIYQHCYPPTEASFPARTTVVTQSMTATYLGSGRVQLSGKVRVKHPWWNAEDEKYSECTFKGYADVDTASRTVKALRMASDNAKYYDANGSLTAPFGVAVSSL